MVEFDFTREPCRGECKCQNKITNMSDEQDEKLWSSFTQEVTMHGIRYIHLKNASSIARLVSYTGSYNAGHQIYSPEECLIYSKVS